VDDGKGEQAQAGVTVVGVVGVEELGAERPASSIVAKLPGKLGQYFSTLNCDSLKGLSLLTRGRLWLLTTPRSASSSATGLEAMLLPRSAWIVI